MTSDVNGTEARTRAQVVISTTLVPIGLAVTMVATALTLKTWIDAQFKGVDTRFTEMGSSIQELKFQMRVYESAMEAKTADRWTATHQKFWASEMRRLNPALVVPSVDDIRK